MEVGPEGRTTYNADGQRVRKESPTDHVEFLDDIHKLLAETDAADQTEMLYTATTEEYGEPPLERSAFWISLIAS